MERESQSSGVGLTWRKTDISKARLSHETGKFDVHVHVRVHVHM